jgi:hypothetical protein
MYTCIYNIYIPPSHMSSSLEQEAAPPELPASPASTEHPWSWLQAHPQASQALSSLQNPSFAAPGAYKEQLPNPPSHATSSEQSSPRSAAAQRRDVARFLLLETRA